MRSLWLHLKNFSQNLWSGLTLVPQIKRRQIPHILENFSKKEIYTVAAAALLLIISGGFLVKQATSNKGPGPHYGGELTEGLVGQPQFINPILALSNNIDTDLSRVVFAQLLKFDENGKIVPDLAEQLPEISADQKTYTLKLRQNLKWQDGKPLSADDVLFTINTIQNPEFESPLQPNWSRVKVSKIDDLTLNFQLREPSNSFINNFAIGILPKHIWEQVNSRNFRLSDINLKAIGAGPYSVFEIKKTSDGNIRSITLKSNSLYHEGQPYINRITFRFYDNYDDLINAYQGREIQSLGFVPFDRKAFGTSDKTEQYKLNLPQYQAVFFNLNRAIVNQKGVRQALWLATDRSPIVTDAYSSNATPVYGPILPEALGFNPEIEKSVHYNLEEAGQILDKAGWILDPAANIRMKDKKPLEFNLVVSGNLVLDVKTAQILQSQWEKLNVKVNLVVVGSNELEQEYVRPRNFDVLLFSENVGADPDPFPFWHTSQMRDPGLNLSSFSNSEADKLLTEARQTTDPAIRVRNYMRFQVIVNEQLPAIFLVRTLYIYDAPKKLRGVNLTNINHPSERFLDINHWYFGE